MDTNPHLDMVEFASDVGAPAAYDVSVVTPLRVDSGFREACVAEPGLASERRHAHNCIYNMGNDGLGPRSYHLWLKLVAAGTLPSRGW